MRACHVAHTPYLNPVAGNPAVVTHEASGAVEDLTGRPPRSLRDIFEVHREELLEEESA